MYPYGDIQNLTLTYIVATKVVRDGIKRMVKGSLFSIKTNKNRDLMHGPKISCMARAITRFALRPALFNASFENICRTAESTGHRRPIASIANPRFQRNCCNASCLDIKCDGDGKSCLGAKESAAFNKERVVQRQLREFLQNRIVRREQASNRIAVTLLVWT